MIGTYTAQKMKFSITDSFIFCAVLSSTTNISPTFQIFYIKIACD